jgi:hypothetical protein
MPWNLWDGDDSLYAMPLDEPVLCEEEDGDILVMYICVNASDQRVGIGGGRFHYDLDIKSWAPLVSVITEDASKIVSQASQTRMDRREGRK